ncbi:MAG: phosphoribosyltransferase family protein [Paracoccaceae bacterium]
MFSDRAEAGQKLAERLIQIAPKGAVVLALPRGGVPVAAVVAAALGAPLDLMLVRKIGAPGQAELAVGAIAGANGDEVVVNDDVAAMMGLTAEDVRKLGDRERPELQRRQALYLAGRAAVALAGKVVILVDDGIATGATAKAALRAIRKSGPAQIILAVPVASPEALTELRAHADLIVCLEAPTGFNAVGAHYARFPQVSDAEVLEFMKAAAPEELRPVRNNP